MLVHLNDITKRYDTFPILNHINLRIEENQKIGVIGNNGSGKTTLLKLIAGIESPDEGIISTKNDIKIGYIKQFYESENIEVNKYLLSSFENIEEIRSGLIDLEQKMADSNQDIEKLLNQYSNLQERFEVEGGYTLETRLESISNGLGITHLLSLNLSVLSGGERTIIELTKLLLQRPDILLLDEPTNHLDMKGISWLENYLLNSKQTCIIVSHDRLFLDNVVSKIFELEDESITEYSGNFTSYKEKKEQYIEELKKDYREQQKEITKLKSSIRRYRQWGNESGNGKFFKRAKSIEKRLNKLELISKPKSRKDILQKSFKEMERSGKEVIQFREVGKIFENRKLFNDLSFDLYWRQRIALIGENGCGKSTILKMILGGETPTSGDITIGSNIKIGYLPQKILYSNPKLKLLDEFKNSVRIDEQNCRSILAKYSFYKDDVEKRLESLSGGEKVRLELAKLIQQEINFLILDEPTNHLDIETREEVETLLENYQGTLLVVSHDRFLLKKLFQDFLVIKNLEVQLYKNVGFKEVPL